MKGQTALEYFIIVSVAFLILLPLVIYANELIISYNDETRISLAENAVKKIGENADWVYSQGQPAKRTTEVYMPGNIDQVSLKNNTVLIRVRTSAGASDLYYNTISPLNGSLPSSEGYYKMSLTAYQNFVNVSW